MLKYCLAALAILGFTAGAANGQNVRMGTRYHLIDKEVESVTTGFRNLEVTTVRTMDGTVETRLRTSDGRAIGDPLVSRPEQVRLVASSKPASGAPDAVYVDLQPLDAVNADRYLAWKDKKLGVRKLFAEIPSDLIGSSGPVEMTAAAAEIRWVRSYSGNLEAFSRIGSGGFIEGREQPSFTSVLRKDDEVLAVMAWFSNTEMLVFQTKSRPEPAYLAAKDIPNGWAFKPNMAWANIQLFSWAKSAESHGTPKPGKGPRLVTNNDPGCDGLHWLDGTILRTCCDDHDACYYKEDPDCSFTSWYFQGSWSCQQCNFNAIFCFAANLIDCFYAPSYCVLYPVYDFGVEWVNCYLYYGCSCPAYCYGCTYIYGQGPCP